MYRLGGSGKTQGQADLFRSPRTACITAQPHADGAVRGLIIYEPQVTDQCPQVIVARAGISLVLPGQVFG
ncbi:MAG: hypothetical protein P8X92_02490 [Dehalococcoidia bacterium]